MLTITPREYVQARGWAIICIAIRADHLPDEDAQNADTYVEGGADALRVYCQRVCEKLSSTGLIRLQR